MIFLLQQLGIRLFELFISLLESLFNTGEQWVEDEYEDTWP